MAANMINLLVWAQSFHHDYEVCKGTWQLNLEYLDLNATVLKR